MGSVGPSAGPSSPSAKLVVVVLVVAAVVVAAGILVVLLHLQLTGGGGAGGGSGPGGNPPATSLPPSGTVSGVLLYQPGEANYSARVGFESSAEPAIRAAGSEPFGVLTASNGTIYRVLVGGGLDAAEPLAISGNFTLKSTSTAGLFQISSFVASAAQHAVAGGAEVNLSSTTVAVSAANLTFGFGFGGPTTFAYLAFGTFPTFFSNVTLEGAVLNASSLGQAFDLNTEWLTSFLHSVDPDLPTSFAQLVVVNRSISLPQSAPIRGQVQEIITPQNVSDFLGSLQGSGGSADTAMVQSALTQLNEELLGLSVVTVGGVQLYFVLAPTQLTRANLTGLVTLDIEASAIVPKLTNGYNAAFTGSSPVPVRTALGVTWDQQPVAASAYQSDSVRGLWSVAGQLSVTVQAAAVGISLSDASSALSGMGYSNDSMISDLATIQNAAIFVLVDPALVQDPNLTAPYQSFALAIVPNDELALQTSVGLYLTVSGVVYNTSYYLGSCATAGIAGCPILVADTVGLGQPAFHTLDELSAISAPTFLRTTGFLAGTTLKTVNEQIGGFSELVSESPVDLGVYDLGWSTTSVGFNLPTLYLTWGTGPTYQVQHEDLEGLYVPLPASLRDTSSWYLDNFGAFSGDRGSTIGSGLATAFQADAQSVSSFVHANLANGSLPVPGVLVMMDVTANATDGALAGTVSGGGTGGCISIVYVSLGSCIIANISLSANTAAYVVPVAAGVNTSLSGSVTATDLATGSCVRAGLVPTACAVFEMACLPGALCSLSPYHVVNVTVYTCYLDLVVKVLACGLSTNLGPPGSVDVTYSISWNGTSVLTTKPFSVTV